MSQLKSSTKKVACGDWHSGITRKAMASDAVIPCESASADGLRKALKNGLSIRTPGTNKGDTDEAPSTWLWPGTAPVVVTIREVKQWAKHLCLCNSF